MTPIDVARINHIEGLARKVARLFIGDWDSVKWNRLIADDVVLSIRPGATDIAQNCSATHAFGCENALRLLETIHGENRNGLSVNTKLVNGSDIVLLGNLARHSMVENTADAAIPIVVHLAFDKAKKLNRMTLAAINLNPLAEAIFAAVRNGVSLCWLNGVSAHRSDNWNIRRIEWLTRNKDPALCTAP